MILVLKALGVYRSEFERGVGSERVHHPAAPRFQKERDYALAHRPADHVPLTDPSLTQAREPLLFLTFSPVVSTLDCYYRAILKHDARCADLDLFRLPSGRE